MQEWFTYMDAQVKSAVRILEILELLGRATRPLSLKNIMDELGYPKSSTHLLMQTLVERGYAVRDDEHRFSLNPDHRNGPGWVTGPHARLLQVAAPIIESLRNATGETIMLGVLNRDLRMQTIKIAVGPQAIRYDSPLSGGSVPSYCSAMGRMLLSARPQRDVDRYLSSERIISYTPYTVIDRAAIRQLIAQAAKNGYSISDQELDIGGSGISAPVFNAAGEVFAALNVAAVSSRFVLNRDKYIEEVIAHAKELSDRLAQPLAG